MSNKTRNLLVVAFGASGILLMTGCATARSPVHWSQECGPATQGHFRNIRFGDLNRDGLMDVVCASTNPGGIKAWLGRGDGTWVFLCDVTSRGKCYDVALSDVNSDGWLDIVAVGLGELLGVRTWLSNADGSLSQRYRENSPWIEDPKATPSKKGKYSRVEVADVNNDGAIDIIAASQLDGEEGGIHVWLGNGENEWMRGGDVVAQGVFRDLAVGDINLDGTVDVAATAFRVPGGIFVWYGSGGGEWFGGEPPTDHGSFWGIAGGDFNCDGLIDIVSSNYQQRGLYIWHRKAAGGWEAPVRLCRDGVYARIKVADFEGDSWLDFAASSADRGGLDLWLRKPGGWQAQHIGESYGGAMAVATVALTLRI